MKVIGGDNLKINSKILGMFIALLAICMVISAASAVDLVNDFNNDNFEVKIASGTNFTDTVNIATNNMKLLIFENSGSDSSDVNSIIYFKDSTADKNQINGFIKDLEKDGSKVEETDKYVVLKNSQNSKDFNISDNIDGLFNFAGGLVSSDGLNVSADGNSISLSSNGFEVSSADGENVSVTSEGISVSGNSSAGNESVNVSSDVDSNIKNSDYSIYLKNQDNGEVIVISGDNLELLKSMAETVSFNGN